MNADEILTYFLKTRELPNDFFELKIPIEKFTFENDKYKIHQRDYYDEAFKQTPDIEIEQLIVILENYDIPTKALRKEILNFLILYPEKIITLLKSDELTKQVFIEKNKKIRDLVLFLVSIYLQSISFYEDNNFNIVDPVKERLMKYIFSNKAFLENLSDELENIDTDKKQIKGFQPGLSNTQIESLYTQMQGEYFDTDMDNFKAIFSPDLKNFKPIKRTKKFTNALLIYFTSELFQKENPSDYVSITEYCFSAKNLSKSQTNYFSYNKNHKPKGFEKIDSIIKTIYSRL